MFAFKAVLSKEKDVEVSRQALWAIPVPRAVKWTPRTRSRPALCGKAGVVVGTALDLQSDGPEITPQPQH